MKALLATLLPDPQLERIRANHAEAIRELQQAPPAAARLIPDVELADGVATPVPHGLGRPARWVRESCVRNATSTGRIEEIRTGDGVQDRSKFVVLKASGWGATVTVDVLVM